MCKGVFNTRTYYSDTYFWFRQLFSTILKHIWCTNLLLNKLLLNDSKLHLPLVRVIKCMFCTGTPVFNLKGLSRVTGHERIETDNVNNRGCRNDIADITSTLSFIRRTNDQRAISSNWIYLLSGLTYSLKVMH